MLDWSYVAGGEAGERLGVDRTTEERLPNYSGEAKWQQRARRSLVPLPKPEQRKMRKCGLHENTVKDEIFQRKSSGGLKEGSRC